MKRYFRYGFSLGIWIYSVFIVYGQEVWVLDADTMEPLEMVEIYNEDQSKGLTTNLFGKADLSIFEPKENISFYHVSHDHLSSTVEKIAGKGYLVLLIPNQQKLNEIVLTANKWNQNKKDLAQKVSTISASEIALDNPQTTADALENTGTVFIQKSQQGGGSPLIRGFSTNRLLITVDGIRMNNAIFRSGNLQNVISIDPLSLNRTEVILGPGSVIYGSDAIGGVMNFKTLDAIPSYSQEARLNAKALVRYSSANQEKTAHGSFNIGTHRWGLRTSVSYTDFDDLLMGRHGPKDYLRPEYVIRENDKDLMVSNPNPRKQVPTGYNQISFLQKVRFVPNERWDLSLGFLYSTTSDYSRYDRLLRYKGDKLRSAEWNYGPQRWLNSYFNALHKQEKGWYNEFRLVAAYQRFEESRMDRNFDSSSRNKTMEGVDAYSINADFEKEMNKKSRLFYGLEYVFNKVHSEGSEENIDSGSMESAPSRYPDGSTWQSIGAYLSYQWKPQPEISLQGGLRYNQIMLKSNFKENNNFFDFPFDAVKLDEGALTSTAGLSWTPNRFIGWRLNLATAFRAPNVDDVGKIFDSEPGSVVIPNPDLNPEYSYGGELGLILNLHPLFSIDLATYYTYLDDALVRRDFTINGQNQIIFQEELSQVQAIQNAAFAKVYGLELGFKWSLTNELEVTAQYNYVGGSEELDDGSIAPARHAAPWFANAHLVWQNDRLVLDFFGLCNGEFSFEDLAPSEVEKDYIYALDQKGRPYSPSWYTLNIRGQYRIGNRLTLTAAWENFTDQRYRPYSSGISGAGSNVIVSAAMMF